MFSDYFIEDPMNDNSEQTQKNVDIKESEEEQQNVHNQAEANGDNNEGESEKTLENDSSEDQPSTHDHKLQLDQIRQLCVRTDISALAKVSQILNIIDGKPLETEESKSSGESSRKRPSNDDVNNEENRKQHKPNEEDVETVLDELGELDSCVVCGLKLRVFKGDKSKELHHYLSHGFRVLKEFDVLKPDDSLFLMCNICNR